MLLKWTAVLLPGILLANIVWLFGVNTVFMDDFEPIADFINIINNRKIDWNALLALHNEHRIVIPRIITHVIAYFTHYNTKFLMMFSVLLLIWGYLIFIRYTVQKKIKEFSLKDILYASVIGCCLFSLKQYENLLWGFQIAWFLIEFCVISGCACLVLYMENKKRICLCMARIMGVLASFSSLHGLAIWPCYLVIVLLNQFEQRQFDYKLLLVIIVTTIIIFLLYFHNYFLPEADILSTGKAKSLMQVVSFFFMNLGCVLVFSNDATMMKIAGITEFVLITFLCFETLVNKTIRKNLLSISLIVFGCGVALMLGIGRASWGIPGRYMTFPCIVVVGCLGLLYNFNSKNLWKKRWLWVCFIILSGMSCLTSYYSLQQYAKLYNAKMIAAAVMIDYKKEPLYILRFIYPFKTYEEAQRRIGDIEHANLSFFYELKGSK